MTNIWSLVKKEVRAYFGSPIAYVVIAGFLLLVGYFYYSLMSWFNATAMQMAQNPYYAQQVNINDMVFSPLFHNMTIILILVAPLLTMRLLAEEKKTGTDELLFTSPLSVGEIIDASVMPVKDEDGNVVFMACEGRDITKEKAQEAEIARKNVERMGDQVGVESEPGQGSRFWIELEEATERTVSI